VIGKARYPRPVYIVLRTIEASGEIASRFINAACFGGSTHQSVSARAYLEWPEWAQWINRLFFWQADHCAEAWASEVANARRTLEMNGEKTCDVLKKAAADAVAEYEAAKAKQQNG